MPTRLAEDYRNYMKTSFIDPLTGLPNYGFFILNLENSIKKSVNENEPVTLALLSIDAFSEINRKHGILKGDAVLNRTGRIISDCIRSMDTPGRLNGDNFAIVFPGTDAEGSFAIINSIKNRILADFKGHVTLSAGIAVAPKHADNIESLVSKAKDALFQARLTGFNETSFFSHNPVLPVKKKPVILVVDDDSKNIKLMQGMLSSAGYSVIACNSGKNALSVIKENQPDLVLLDIMMPGMDGYDVCKRIKNREETRRIPVIFLTALNDRESKIAGIEAGADDFISKPPDRSELVARIKSLINVKKLNNRLVSFENILFSISNAVEAKDRYTRGHIKRVATLAVAIGKALDMGKDELEALWVGGILHDIGKIATPLDILNKPGPLDDRERSIMRQHPDTGYMICHPLKNNLKDALDIVRHHHEFLDGTGYPDMLGAEKISISVRIMAVVDIYDALTTDRPYRKALPADEAFMILDDMASRNKIDGRIVDLLKKQQKNGKMD